jgi:hypothetical protein
MCGQSFPAREEVERALKDLADSGREVTRLRGSEDAGEGSSGQGDRDRVRFIVPRDHQNWQSRSPVPHARDACRSIRPGGVMVILDDDDVWLPALQAG